MSCVKHLGALWWEHHAWSRQVNQTEYRSLPETDQWGRTNSVAHVFCHIQYVCRACGAVRDGEDCRCDRARAEECAIRLAWLDKGSQPDMANG